MNKIIGKKIHVLRDQKGFSQEQLADKLHISQSAYSRMENGETNSWVDNLKKICQVLDVKPEDLVATEGLVQNNSDSASAVQNHTQHDTHITINHLSEKVIELYEDKIKLLENQISLLENR
jgi:transcriptional regulator with XRE-family HTH domain